MNIIKLLLFSVIISFFSITLLAELGKEIENTQKEISDSTEIKSLLIGNLTFGPQTEAISPLKIEAAINLAAMLSGKYYLIPFQIRDSVANYLSGQGVKPLLNVLADTLRADKILFLNLSRIHNMLRMEISSVDTRTPDNKTTGEGYALIHYMEGENKPLFDPSLLEAAQRALAVAVNDSNLYADTESDFRIYPVETMVVGGIEYIDNPNYLPKWEIFDNQVISSYDAVESIFKEAKDSPRFVVYDIPTRDTIFALFNMYIVENYRPPSVHEIEALDKFLIKNYISGKITKFKQDAEIELTLHKIINGRLKFVRSEKGILDKDDIDGFRLLIKQLTRKLLKMP
ncbi:hypothetical protein ACFLSQ_06805 [Bacteroidota bacterium]